MNEDRKKNERKEGRKDCLNNCKKKENEGKKIGGNYDGWKEKLLEKWMEGGRRIKE